MTARYVPFYHRPDLCQVASTVSWDFLSLLRDDTGTTAATDVAKRALDLCHAIDATIAAVRGGIANRAAASETMPATGQRLLPGVPATATGDTPQYEAIADYACQHTTLLEGIASGAQDATQEQLEQLRRHFASVSLILVEADL